MRLCHRAILMLALPVSLPACSPPPQRLIEECRQTAIRESVDHQLNSDDIGELTETCMASKGFELRETGKRCTEDMRLRSIPDAIIETICLAVCRKRSGS
jgi:hypothetical protein